MLLPHYQVHEGEGPPLLMVHGFLSSRAQWTRNLSRLREVASPVVVELFGHGRSDAPTGHECYTPTYYVDAFDAIRNRLGIDRWSVLGYSLGAGLTLRYSLTYPERVFCQLFTNSTSAFAEDHVTANIRDNAKTILDQYAREGLSAVESIPVHPRRAKRLPAALYQALIEDCKLLDPNAVARTIVFTNGSASVRRLAKHTTVPTILLCGVHEKRFTPHREFAEANIPGLTVVEISAGHAVNAEAADAFNEHATEFLKQHTHPSHPLG